MPNAPWTEVLASAAVHRSRDTPYFKPVCLIAIVDLIEEGRIDPAEIDVDPLVERISLMVDGVHPGRPDMRWRPIWHLTNDGAWIYTRRGQPIGPADFGLARKPDSYREWRASFDRVAVPDLMLPHWRSPHARALLRGGALTLLEAGDAVCQALATKFGAVPALSGGIVPMSGSRRGQGFLDDADARRAIELHAMQRTTAWLEGEGWGVIDRSALHSYDLLAERAGQHMFVEVKGTTGTGDQIELTRNEVTFAQANSANMMLAVVAGIELHRAGDDVVAGGGELVVRSPWAPDPAALRAIAYMCDLGAVA